MLHFFLWQELKEWKWNSILNILDFMISAPSQGVVAIASRVDDVEAKEILQQINHKETQICVEIERNFLRTLEGGCTAPIGAIAKFEEDKITF